MVVNSTQDATDRTTLKEAIFSGLPYSGGLFQPFPHPNLKNRIKSLSNDNSFTDIASIMIYELLSNELGGTTRDEKIMASKNIAESAFSFEPKLSTITKNITLLELFHGPTCAFKDFGASFLATLIEYFQQLESSISHQKKIVIAATSGDTGGAVARAFWKRNGNNTILLYPSGRISNLQERQLTSLGGNIHALEVDGSFDYCQKLVKSILSDENFTKTNQICPANSISLGRLIPQTFYYIFAWLKLQSNIAPVFSVPSGNFGNLTAGMYAQRWGLPVSSWIAATNNNDIIPQYLNSGKFNPQPSIRTLSNAMDVGNPSNFERILALFDHNHETIKCFLHGYSITDKETLLTMKSVYNESGYLMDPHTAVGVAAAQKFHANCSKQNIPTIILSTAHPAKFPEIVEKATGKNPRLPKSLEDLLHLPKKSIRIKSLTELQEFIMQFL